MQEINKLIVIILILLAGYSILPYAAYQEWLEHDKQRKIGEAKYQEIIRNGH